MPPRPPRPFHRAESPRPERSERPPLRPQVTTLWAYPSMHYDAFYHPETGELTRTKTRHQSAGFAMQGDKAYVGATPSWVIWNLLARYTKPGDTVLDPMCGSGTTIDVCNDLSRSALAFDLSPRREDIKPNDARKLPLKDRSVDFAFIDPPYSTHVDYSENPKCIGKLDAAGEDHGEAYYTAMQKVILELARVLKPGGHLGLYVSDSWRRTQRAKRDVFMPIGFHLFAIMSDVLSPVDIIAVQRLNQKLDQGNHRKAAEEQNFFLRGFNYLFVMKKD